MQEYYQSLLGGALIGVAASLLLLFSGRVCGISGIYNGLFKYEGSEWTWRSLFVLGLIVGGALMNFLAPQLFINQLNFSYLQLTIAGLCVGFGTVMGGGCTSGHGICGISRFSKRSIVATLVFMATAVITVALQRLLGAV